MDEIKYTYRGLDEADKKRVAEWLKADEHHSTSDPDFFTEQRPGVAHMVMEHKGEPVFYVTVENVARVHIQFNPNGSKIKTAKALMSGFKWLLGALKSRGYHELIFDSKYPPLMKFCQSALGFLKRDNDFSARL